MDASLFQADAKKQRSLAGLDWTAQDHTRNAPRAVREYLATLDEAVWGVATDVEPKFVSPSDPAAQWTAGSGSWPSALQKLAVPGPVLTSPSGRGQPIEDCPSAAWHPSSGPTSPAAGHRSDAG